jgi:serine/threonine-protein phosphatase 6 regulatory ankyrin repeat subunit A/serine/threonine-protein phosphatase 6 regulatory ankyrin repeat subunit B
MLIVSLLMLLLNGGCDGNTQLVKAIRDRDITKVERLLKSGIDVNSRVDSEGRTAIMLAALEGISELTQLLIDHGADTRMSDKHGRTALHFGARVGDCLTISVLVSHGAVINPQNDRQYTALMEAANSGKAEAVVCLVNLGAEIDRQDGGDFTALMHAVWSHDLKTVEALLDAGADQTVDEREETPLQRVLSGT